ncbi:hypothetical protein M5689_000564 [Euphorbia peplus]|nr:hypothetical protein M5689_000564 [Euphorbia peplus]
MKGSDETIADFSEPNRIDNLMGAVVYGDEEAYNLYNSYAIKIGFSVRKSKKRPSVDGKIRQRELCCAKQGEMQDKDLSVQQRQSLVTRTGCEAMIRFTIEGDGWKVTSFVPTHNQELALPSEIHMLRSNRKLTSSKTNVIDSMVDAGLKKQ